MKMMMIVIMLYGQLADKPTRPRVQTSYSEFCDTFEFFFGPVLMSASWCVGELVVGELSCRRVGVSASCLVGELVCRRIGMSASWLVGELVCRRVGLSASCPVTMLP